MKELKIMGHLISNAFFISSFFIFSLLTSCSVSKKISRQAGAILLKDTAIRTGHIGISIYEPATGKYWYEHNPTNYFIPASNTKLYTLYAGMKYLGDSLRGFAFKEINDTIYFRANGDPTFLHPEFKSQGFFNLLKTKRNIVYKVISNPGEQFEALGNGWAWNDYKENYMVERNRFPLYGNLVEFRIINNKLYAIPSITRPPYFKDSIDAQLLGDKKYIIQRKFSSNDFWFERTLNTFTGTKIPFHNDRFSTQSLAFLKDTLKNQEIYIDYDWPDTPGSKGMYAFYSQPSDSLFKPMMHRSDNFFAEQTLLMASNEYLGYMNDEKIIDTILKTTLKDVPQRPKWVDGSGLSRYNLFTPRSFVYILHKMSNDFGMERMKAILPTGGEGTLFSYFKKDSGYIYAKTGTLSNNCALSGYLITRKGKLLIFSILANNYITGATPVRKATEKFLLDIRKKF